MKMKKLLTALLTVLLVMSLFGCGKKEPKTPEYYGDWDIVKVVDPSGAISEEQMASILVQLKDQDALFTITIGDECYFKSAGQEVKCTIDMDNHVFVEENGAKTPFEYTNGQIILTDESSGYQFVMEKVK